MSRPRRMFLGAAMPPMGGMVTHHHVPPHHLVTHGVVLGMTGSGKTGLLMVTVEEALRSQVPVIMIDVKGDLPNLLLAFSSFEPSTFAPWTDGQGSPEEAPVANLAEQLANERRRELGAWGISPSNLELFGACCHRPARVDARVDSGGARPHPLVTRAPVLLVGHRRLGEPRRRERRHLAGAATARQGRPPRP